MKVWLVIYEDKEIEVVCHVCTTQAVANKRRKSVMSTTKKEGSWDDANSIVYIQKWEVEEED